MTTSHVRLLLLSVAFGALGGAALAQQAPPSGEAQAGGSLNEIVVTALPGNPLSKIKSSVSVSTLKADAIQQSAPSSAADIVRDIPGFRSEASGGEGNANVSVRGLPLASGGAKYVQFQEDGLPLLQYGDIDFATGDQFLRADFNIDRVEAIRGGSSSTAVSDAPGGVINFIDKDGKVAGGDLGVTAGLDYDEQRYDFDYGAPIADGTRFHIGGFYHTGQGPRDIGYDAVSGGQIKFNITHDIEGGFIKFDFKYLDDRSPVFLPVPIALAASGSASNYPGFSANSGVTQTPYLLSDIAINANGQRVTTDVSDGYHSHETAFGGEINKEIGGGWKLDDKLRVSSMGGDFVGPYTQNVGTNSALAGTLGYAGGNFTYANGPQAGQAFTGYAQEIALFNVKLNDVGNYFNDLKVNKTFDQVAGGSASLQAGVFSSRQNIVEDWHWNTYLEEVKSKDAALLNLTSGGQMITAGGLFAYGEPAFGNCCIRYYDVHYTTNAPYLSASWQTDKLNIDGSLRYDIAQASGVYGGATGTSVINVNNTQTLTTPDQKVPVVNTYYPVGYTKGYLSYSFGANYQLDPDLAVFARTSEGGRFNAERLLFGGGVSQGLANQPAIGTTSQNDAVNEVWQTEGGVKYRTGGFSLFLTAFYAVTQETNADFTNAAEPYVNDTYHADGVEAEITYRLGDFSFRGGATYTDATIAKALDNPATVGKVPQRQAPWVYQFTPSYKHGPVEVGFNVIGTTDSYTSNANTQVMPGYVEVNMFASYAVTANLKASIAGNNIFNAIGITEVDGANVARSINGETFSGSLKYSF